MGMRQFVAGLHAAGQYYVPIVDSNIYAPNPENASDAYEPWSRGAELGTFIRDPTTGGESPCVLLYVYEYLLTQPRLLPR